ncbi:MAG: DUF1553 domain-containing protein [Pirellulaceae bacterium]|nr:DUF1553 domain-containing protein [Pirellulaceae bacterium]
MFVSLRKAFGLGLLVVCNGHLRADTPAAGSPPTDLSAEARAILSDRCFTCHGPDASQRVSELRLDDQQSTYEWAVQPGNSAGSELVKRIMSSDPDYVMPPPSTKSALSDQQKQTLQRWIDLGATFDRHWSFEPLRELTPPPMPQSFAWNESSNPIDAWVGQQLRAIGLEPSERADLVTLIRRLTIDLTGLLPTEAELDEWLSTSQPGNCEPLVDRLLGSPHFGEKWAVDWLDAARYADTFGYQADVYRATWPWRDWVVRALNDNLPFDQFITWQLAGDLLPNPTRDQLVATAFNRLHRQTNEGGSVEEEFRSEYVADRVNTFGAAFLGLTMECARCHDHKYDPITQREYYQLSAFFNNIDESGLYSHFTSAVPTPALPLPTPEQESQIAQLADRIAQKRRQLQQLRVLSADQIHPEQQPISDQSSGSAEIQSLSRLPEVSEQISAIQQRLNTRQVAHYSFDSIADHKLRNEVKSQDTGKVSDSPSLIDGVLGQGLLLSGENNATIPEGGSWTRHQPFTISLWIRVPRHFNRCVVFHRSRAWTDAGSRGYELLLEDGKLSAAMIHFWPGNAVRVLADQPLPLDQWCQVTWVYDGSSQADGMELYVNGQRQATSIVRDCLTQSAHGSEASELTIGQRFRDVGFKDGRVDELRLYEAALTELECQYLYWQDTAPDSVAEQMALVSPQQWQQFAARCGPEQTQLESELFELRTSLSQLAEPIPEMMVMRELPEPRPTFVLRRGTYDQPQEAVERGVPESILSLASVTGQSNQTSDVVPAVASVRPSRLDLAQWLTSPQHPLTARVAVNRIWQSLFGRGLVSTAEDFGSQGTPPTHPDLLDWLAGQYIRSGWNTKALIKLIVTSQTYQQSSTANTALLRDDPENRWLARGPAVRLSAEQLRDAALQAGNLLVTKLGGPPVKPYQPDGLWEEKSGQAYQRDIGEGSRRRSVYTFWKRTSPPPMMMTFDASNREVCMVQRQRTLTPLQTLVLLNDPQFVEAARGLASHVAEQHGHLPDRLKSIFRRLTARQPVSAELDVLQRLYAEQFDYFQSNPSAIEQFLTVGDFRAPDELVGPELAALCVVAEGLMSYDEFVMKR